MAIEAAGGAIEALGQAARRHQRSLIVQHRDLFRAPLDSKELAKFDAVVLDPPRAGARAQAEMLARSSVPRIAMVSCNPNSFARAAQIMVEIGREWSRERVWQS